MQKIRGTRDILSNEMQYWHLMIQTAQNIFEQASYLQISTPIIENTNLFVKSIGQNTDIISKEMYNFYDQSNRNITLRPEGTSSIVRALLQNKLYDLNTINRIWYCGPMFRYERPQSGRQRQFFQLGIECFGTTNPRADIEIIYLVFQLFQQLQCQNFTLEINSIGDIFSRAKFEEELRNYLLPYMSDLDKDSKARFYTNPLRILDTKNYSTQSILVNAPKLYNFLDYQSKQHFERVCQYLSYLNVPYLINSRLVRGLDYYNNTAFEIKTSLSNIVTTVCGGGRYDNLVYQLGHRSVPAVGCAIGIERLYYLLRETINFNTPKVDIYIASQGYEASKYSLYIMKFLQVRKFYVHLDLSNKTFKKQLKKANKVAASACLIIGYREMLNTTIVLKWLNSGAQEVFHQSELYSYAQYLKNKINGMT